MTLGRFELTGAAHPGRREAGPDGLPVPGHRSLKAAMTDYEKHLIRSSLEASRWRRGEAARALGINRRTLYKKLRQYGID